MTSVRADAGAAPVALVLAGRRPGGDALAAAHGVSHKALLPVAGRPMIERVLRALEGAGLGERLRVVIDDPAALDAVAAVTRLEARGRLARVAAAASPAASVAGALAALPLDTPVLVTTADHPLLTPDRVRAFWRGARERRNAEVAVGVVEEAVVRARFPTVRRTFVPLPGGGVTGANMFAFQGAGARRAVDFWRRAEAFRKRPVRLVATLGPATLALFLARRLDLEGAFARASRALGARLVPVRLAEAECALDVDRPEHLELADRLLRAVEEADPAEAGEAGAGRAGPFTRPS